MFETTKETAKVGKVITVYGEGGIGKTTIIAQAVKERVGVFVSCGEDGISPLQQDGASIDLQGIEKIDSVITKWDGEDGFVNLLRHLAKSDHKCIGFDSVSMLMQPLEDFCFKKYYLDDAQAHGQNKSPEELRKKAYGFAKSELLSYMAKEFDEFLKALRYMRGNGVDVFITTHTATKKARVLGEEMEYDFASLDFPSNKSVSLDTSLYNISDAVLYGKRDVTVYKGKRGGVAGGSNDCLLQTVGTPIAKAKNRFNMPDEIPAKYEELNKYIN